MQPPNSLSAQEKERIAAELSKRGVPRPCPMCGTNQWAMADGYFTNSLQFTLTSMQFGGPSIPTIALVCGNCGFVSQHALGILGILPSEGVAPKHDPRGP